MGISVGSTQHLNTSGELQNISSLDSTTQATISNAVGGNFTHPDTSSQASVDNSGSTVIQDITLDTNGHVTGITSTDVSSSTGGVSILATGTQSASSSGGGTFTIAAGSSYANKVFITMVISNIQYLAGGGFNIGTTDSSGNISGQVVSIGNPYTYSIKWAVLG